MNSLNVRNNQSQKLEVPWDGVPKHQFQESLIECFTGLTSSINDAEILILMQEVTTLCMKFSEYFYTEMESLKPQYLESFIKLCKTRDDDLTTLMSKLSTIDAESEIFLVYNNNTKITEIQTLKYISGKSSIFASSEDDDIYELYTFERKPRWYKPLFLAVLKLMELAHQRASYSKQSFYDCIMLANAVITTGRLYLELRSNPHMIQKQEKEAVLTMRSLESPKRDKNFWILFESVVQDIKENKLPYVKEFADALQATRDIFKSAFSEEDYFISTKAATSRLKTHNQGKSMSFLNSCFEHDPFLGHPVQEKIGYISHYNKEQLEGYSYDIIRGCSIDQHKAKRRIIKSSMNAVQDICCYIHNRMTKFLNLLPTDCTREQERGVRFTVRVTDRKWRLTNGLPSVLCLDITDATGTIDQEFETRVMGLFWDSELIQFWRDLLSSQQKFRYADGSSETFIQRTGQPQGVLGSFELFATDHHFMMLMAMKKSGLVNSKARQFYRILGDDNVVSSIFPDPERRVLNNILYVYQGANWSVNLSKCRLTHNEDQIALGEFAKVTVLDGRVASPLPIRLMSRYSYGLNPTYAITTCLWGQTHNYGMLGNIDLLLDKWYSYNELDYKIASTFIKGGISKHFQCFRDPVNFLQDKNQVRVGFCFLLTKIRGTFVESLLPKDARNNLDFEDKPLKDIFQRTFGKNHKKWLDLIQDPEHKVRKLINKNITIDDAINEILGITEGALIAAGLNLTETERSLIQLIQEILEDISIQGDIGDYDMPRIRRALKESESFNRFQLRSISKSGGREASYLAEIIQQYKVLFPNLGELLVTDDQLTS